MEFSPFDLMVDVGLISILLVIGNVLRHRIKFVFQDLLLPAPVTAGLLGLLLGPNVLGIFKDVKVLVSELKESDAAVLGASALGWEAKDVAPAAEAKE